MKKLDAEGLTDSTIVIFSSDSGPILNDGYYDEAVEKNGDHTPSGQFRGGKYSLFDAGTHVPFIVSWPARIRVGVSGTVVCQMDLLALLAGSRVKSSDSQNLSGAFLGQSQAGRENMVLEASGRLAFRSGDWLLIPPYPGKPVNEQVNIETGLNPSVQLYNLKTDPGQRTNLASALPNRVNYLGNQLKRVVGRAFQLDTTTLKLQ